MKVFLATHLLAAALVAGPGFAAEDEKGCPIDRVVAVVRSVAGDAGRVHLRRPMTEDPPVTVGTCIRHGDRLEAGPEAVVTIETTTGFQHVGGQYDPVFQAPEAAETVTPGVVAYVAALYHSLFSRSGLTVYATGRANVYAAGQDQCVPAEEEASPLVPLDRLAETRQRIGADLEEIVAAWKPSGQPHSVRATLRGKDGKAIAYAETCSSAHVALPLRPGDIHPGEVLALEITDSRGGRVTYELTVVEPKDLPLPPAAMPSEWLVAAWRLAAGPAGTRLDSIARLQTAPADTLAAQAISEAIWSGAKF